MYDANGDGDGDGDGDGEADCTTPGVIAYQMVVASDDKDFQVVLENLSRFRDVAKNTVDNVDWSNECIQGLSELYPGYTFAYYKDSEEGGVGETTWTIDYECYINGVEQVVTHDMMSMNNTTIWGR